MNREKVNYELNEIVHFLENIQEEVGSGVEEEEIFDYQEIKELIED